MEEQYSSVLVEKVKVDERVTELNSQLDTERATSKLLKSECEQLADQNNSLTSTLTSRAQLLANEQNNSRVQADKYKTIVKELNAALEAKENILKDTNTQITALNVENGDLVQQLTNLREDNESNAEANRRALETKQKRIDSYEKLEKEFDEFRIKFTAIKKERDELERKNIRLEDVHAKEISQLKQKLSTDEEELKQYRDKLFQPNSMSSVSEGKTVLMDLVNKYEDASRQLQVQKAENRQLNTYLQAILKEIEAKAPVLQLQKQHFQKTKFEKIKLTQLAKKTIQHSEKLKNENQQLLNNIAVMKSTTDSLHKQISVLMQENHKLSNTSSENIEDMDTDESSSSNTFKNLDELLNVNAALQTEVESLKQYKSEGYDLLYQKALESKQKLQVAYDLLSEKHKRLQVEKERYIVLYDNQRAIANSIPQSASGSNEMDSTSKNDADMVTSECNEDLEQFKNKTQEIIDTLKHQFEDYTTSYPVEKFVTFENRINLLQERNKSLIEQIDTLTRETESRRVTDVKQRDIISKYEEQLLKSSQDVQAIKSSASEKSQELERALGEIVTQKKICDRLKGDIDTLRKDNETLQSLTTIVQVQCKAERETFVRRSNRLIEDNKQTRAELVQLQQLSDKEYESHKQSLISFQEQIISTKKQLEETQSLLAESQKQLSTKQLENQHLIQQSEQLQVYVNETKQQMQRISKSLKLGGDDSNQALQELHAQLAQATSKTEIQQSSIDSLREEVLTLKRTIIDLKKVIQAVEQEKASLTTLNSELEQQLQESSNNNISQPMEVDSTENRFDSLENQLQDGAAQMQETLDLCTTQSKKIEELRTENASLESQLTATLNKYDQRFKLHALDVETHTATKQLLQEVSTQKENLTKQLQSLESTYSERVSTLESQLESARQRESELSNENAIILEKLDQFVAKSFHNDEEKQSSLSILDNQELVSDSNDNIEELKDVISFKDRERNRLLLAFEDLRNEKDVVERKYKQLMVEVKAMRTSKASLDEYNNWKTKYEDVQKQVEELQQVNACLEDSNKTFREKHQKNLDYWKKSIAQGKREKKVLETQLAAEVKKQTDNTVITQKNAILAEQQETLQKVISTLKSEMEKVKSELVTAKNEIVTLTNELTTAKNTITTSSTTEKKLKLMIIKQKKQIAALSETQAKPAPAIITPPKRVPVIVSEPVAVSVEVVPEIVTPPAPDVVEIDVMSDNNNIVETEETPMEKDAEGDIIMEQEPTINEEQLDDNHPEEEEEEEHEEEEEEEEEPEDMVDDELTTEPVITPLKPITPVPSNTIPVQSTPAIPATPPAGIVPIVFAPKEIPAPKSTPAVNPKSKASESNRGKTRSLAGQTIKKIIPPKDSTTPETKRKSTRGKRGRGR